MDDLAFKPDWFSKPGDTLLTLMEQRELTVESLSKKLGRPVEFVRGLLAGTVAVDSNIAIALAANVGGTPKFWELRQQRYQSALERTAGAISDNERLDWITRFPHADMARNGW